MSTALSVQHLHKTYVTGVHALRDVSLDIDESDFFALLGANGAGKTTMIGILTGLVTKTSGTVSIFGLDMDSHVNETKKYIGVVPQEFNFSIFEKVIDIIVSQAGYYGIPRAVALPRARALLAELELGDKENAVARTLSGGMKRRLMIARALIHEPRFLILDEPTAGVDVELRIGMWDYLARLNREKGTTIILTTHYLEEVTKLCRNAAFIRGGEIVRQDSVKNLLRSLDRVVYTVELDQTKNINTTNTPLPISVIDAHTVEITVTPQSSLDDYLAFFVGQSISVRAIEPKGNALESIFLDLIKK